MASELPRSPGSTVAASEVDDHHTVLASSPIRTDTRHSINHLLSESARETPPATKHGDHETPPDDDDGRMANAEATAEAPASSARRRREGQSAQINPMYVGNKLRHLKKDDGEPLWRKDIQYAFLKAIFENDLKVFTNSYEPWDNGVPRRQTFADLYIDTMARSSKTSKILRDKLLTEHEPARNMAMVCLLVNLGRMNTTLNCKSAV